MPVPDIPDSSWMCGNPMISFFSTLKTLGLTIGHSTQWIEEIFRYISRTSRMIFGLSSNVWRRRNLRVTVPFQIGHNLIITKCIESLLSSSTTTVLNKSILFRALFAIVRRFWRSGERTSHHKAGCARQRHKADHFEWSHLVSKAIPIDSPFHMKWWFNIRWKQSETKKRILYTNILVFLFPHLFDYRVVDFVFVSNATTLLPPL